MGQNFAAQVAALAGGGVSYLNLDAAGNLKVVQSEGPVEPATPVIKTSGNVAAAVATATLPAVSGKTNYLTGFDITSSGSTAAAVVLAALTGLLGGTINYVYATVAGATLANPTLSVRFDIPLPASAANTAISLSLPTLGAGNTNAVVNLYGYVQ
jgi:hypothetical protein